MRVLLLNPPGRGIYIRDYFCSKTTKSNYLFHPIDLVMLSGTLASEHEIEVLDAIAERLEVTTAHGRIEQFAPDVIVALVGSVSWEEDRAFLQEQHSRGRRILAIGDVLQEATAKRLDENPWLEATLHVFANDDALRYLRGEREDLAAMTVRDTDGQPVSRRNELPRGGKPYRIPRPRHELFPDQGYHFSFARGERFATVLTDYGCPYPCTFCVIGTLGFGQRPIEDVLEEIDSLRARGIHELFVMDQTFGVRKERGLELCEALAQRGDLSWTTFTRPDVADDELLAAMHRAGCHTVILGVESADDTVLAATKKGYRSSAIAQGFARAKHHGLRTVGTFIIGLPEETESSLRATLDLALDLDLDFMSLNMAVPRFGTPFRQHILDLGLAQEGDLVMDQGGANAFLPTNTLDRATMLRLKKRAVRRFYLRPTYLWRRLRETTTLRDLKSQAAEGLALLRRNL